MGKKQKGKGEKLHLTNCRFEGGKDVTCHGITSGCIWV